MSNEYRNNHYVPEWYQKLFIDSTEKDRVLYYLDLKPDTFTDSRGVSHPTNVLRKVGPRKCFAENDLYTATFGSYDSTKIEQVFFGDIDTKGRGAVKYFTDFTHPSVNGKAFNDLVMYMSTQKIRTPKGLQWLAHQANSTDQNAILKMMIGHRHLFCAIWTECIWQIADASNSDTKFIISDHPVTIYNRRCGPRSMWCRNFNDPDIRFHASHTIFPLSLEKVLILTNLSWVRNPYQKETGLRPNPNFYRQSIFNFTTIQILRYLSEQEVREINFIIKSRAFRYIAAGQKDWLYPERHISKSDWNTYGHGYLLMPDPRAVNYGGELIMGWEDGTATSFDAYGRRPWQSDYDKESKNGNKEFETLYRFKGEFARLFGPHRRGRSFEVGQLDKERDSDDFHKYHLSLVKKKRSRT